MFVKLVNKCIHNCTGWFKFNPRRGILVFPKQLTKMLVKILELSIKSKFQQTLSTHVNLLSNRNLNLNFHIPSNFGHRETALVAIASFLPPWRWNFQKSFQTLRCQVKRFELCVAESVRTSSLDIRKQMLPHGLARGEFHFWR